MSNSKDKDKMGSVNSESAYGTGIFVREDVDSNETPEFSNNPKVKTADEILAERELDNAMHKGAQRNKRTPPRSVIDIHKEMVENQQREKLKHQNTGILPMPATESPAEKAGREAAEPSVKQINEMELQNNAANKQRMATRLDREAPYDSNALRGSNKIDIKEKGPAIPKYGHAAAAAWNEAIRNRSHHSEHRRKHATREQRLEAKANRVFNQSLAMKNQQEIYLKSRHLQEIPPEKQDHNN